MKITTNKWRLFVVIFGSTRSVLEGVVLKKEMYRVFRFEAVINLFHCYINSHPYTFCFIIVLITMAITHLIQKLFTKNMPPMMNCCADRSLRIVEPLFWMIYDYFNQHGICSYFSFLLFGYSISHSSIGCARKTLWIIEH